MAATTIDLPPSTAPPYWCHTCSRTVTVNPATADGPELQCPYCNTGFLEQISSGSIPLLLPLLFGLVASPANPSASSVSPETPSSDAGPETSQEQSQGREEDQVEERIILVDPANQAIIVQTRSSDELLSEFIENEILRNGWIFGGGEPSSSPASKEAVEALASVVVEDEEARCVVCLEGFGADGEAREMPCRHRYHHGCIMKWLEKHSTCPVCRFQMPVEEKKPAAAGGVEGEEEGRRRRRRRTVVLSVPLVIGELMSLRRREVAARSDADSETLGQESGSTLGDQHDL
ncbi:E3 ubiquitin-protein ligase MPSR1-like [Nymphaea colorata]|nr:E3 ubiquitin-protein ligase MPSR1-like [Nymphaea colorata]